MTDRKGQGRLSETDRGLMNVLEQPSISPLDLLPHRDLREKLVDLVLHGVPALAGREAAAQLGELRMRLLDTHVEDVKVVVFGGGTGLANIIGGDSRQKNWADKPFDGLKKVFPRTRAVVCVTDDGGSTGELLKDLPVIGIGDIRHVLVSSIQSPLLERTYRLSPGQAATLVRGIGCLFNHRFEGRPASAESLFRDSLAGQEPLPEKMAGVVLELLEFCFSDDLCARTLARPHCLGNLLIVAAIRMEMGQDLLVKERIVVDETLADKLDQAISSLGEVFGAGPEAVLPCTPVPAQLRFRYSDGVEVSGESKSSLAERGAAVARVTVDFCGPPCVSARVLGAIRAADILIMAPGSLYSSIIPVLQVPGIAEAVRSNAAALKLLIANLWVQDGETDKAMIDPDRKFHVSDMIRAYDLNLPGGVDGLFDQVLCLSMQDVPASMIQNYAVEGKNPIYLDREILREKGFEAVECGFFSKSALHERGVIQHDPEVVAQTVKTLFLARELSASGPQHGARGVPAAPAATGLPRLVAVPSLRYAGARQRFEDMQVNFCDCESERAGGEDIRTILTDIVWFHQDIPLSHLDLVDGVAFIGERFWRRDQRWDNVFSFYDPQDRLIKIREDRLRQRVSLEMSFLIALGQALLGDYAAAKTIAPLLHEGREIGAVYHLHLRAAAERSCYFNDRELRRFLTLARMVEQGLEHFTRTINGQEGFTPPGLLMGLLYAWYLDNRFAGHIEYKMSILKVRPTELIPEQKRMRSRREQLIDFFRETVFGKEAVHLEA